MFDSKPQPAPGLEEARSIQRALSVQIQAAMDRVDEGTNTVERVSIPLGIDVSPLEWIRAQDLEEAVYWAGRDSDRTVAAVGAARVLRSTDIPVDYGRLQRRLAPRLSALPADARYYGGLRFDASQAGTPAAPDRSWDAFGTYRFILPRFELLIEGETTALACNLVFPQDSGQKDALASAVRSLSFPEGDSSDLLPAALDRTDSPSRTEWNRMVRWALDTINDGALDKVVLARRIALGFGAELDPFRLLRHLRLAAPNSFHFGVRPAEGPAFVGASPERLVCRYGDRIRSEAVAGTRPRGETPEADEVLREELLRSPKERREHAFVQEAICSNLETLCVGVQTPDPPSDLTLTRSRHLHAPITGTLRPDTSTIDLIQTLHPTPAVGGVPTEVALEAIRSREPFDRGWYAGPIGWIGPQSADFAVAIRSGLVDDTRTALFSGAGIVEGSVAEREWEEVEQKIGDFAAIMGLNGHPPEEAPAAVAADDCSPTTD